MLAAIGAWSSAVVAEPVLHEYFDVEGHPGMAVSPDAPAGAAWEPELLDPAVSAGAVAAPIGADPGDDYRLDRNTARPDQVVYSDPFTPSVPPFKRLYAYDTVREDLSLGVANAGLEPVTRGGVPGDGDDQFFAELSVELQAGASLRIPSVGPQTRILAAQLSPEAPFEIGADSAGNWFISSSEPVKGRLSLHLSIDRRVFGTEFRDAATWAGLAKRLPSLPENLEEQTAAVLSHLQLSQALSPKQVVARLIAYFRAFSPSEERPVSTGTQLYQDITLSQAGVCRHRAFAFVVTALSLGIPTRFVRNEAHAWVEVWDERLWHRIDLGGAAERMAYREAPLVSHVPPEDPYDWPADSESGTAMVERAAFADGAAASNRGPAPSESESDDADPTDPFDRETPGTAPSSALAEEPETRELRVSFVASTSEITRGERFSVSGTVGVGNDECGLLRIDVALINSQRELTPIGTLATNATGHFEGEVAVPTSVAVGDYQLVVTTPGNDRCGPATSSTSR